jgi:hypothetical protein
MKKFDESEILDDEDRREVLKDAKTSYVPEILDNNTNVKPRHKREVMLDQQNVSDFTN